MKKKYLILSLVLACILHLPDVVFGQKVTKDEWRRQLQTQEAIVNDYVEKKLNTSNHEGLVKKFYASIEHEADLKKADLPVMLSNYIKSYYRAKYFEENPGLVSLYNPGRVQLAQQSSNATAPANVRNVACFNGNFEDDLTLADYTGFTGPIYTGNECTFVPAGPVAYTPTSFAIPDAFLLTNNAPDPLIPALNQTHNSSAHAMRINASTPCTPGRGINMLQRSFVTPGTGLYQINFSYALVMENPKGHGNAQPFFVARVLNGAGVEVGSRICRISDLTNPIYNTTGYVPNPGCGNTDSLVWRDWTCASISFQGDPSQTFTVEFFAADCAAGAHFGYAYIDDICASECCPKFFMRDCCDMHGGASGRSASDATANSTVRKILEDYSKRMSEKYNWANSGGADPCCNPCAYPNDPYPVFIMDEFNNLISSTDYVISWSHDPGNTSAYAFILPNQQTIITVRGPGNCVWTDTLKLNCCKDTITITPFCTWDPCKYPNSPFPVRVLDQNGNTLTSAGGYTFFWTYGANTSTGDAITATLASFPVIVTVKNPDGCVYTDTLDMKCCKANRPINLKCKSSQLGSHISWDPVPGAHYKVVITANDPACCPQGTGLSFSDVWDVAGTDTLVPITFTGCFSWKVIAICPDGTKSPESVTMCSCTPPSCVPKTPVNLKCNTVTAGSQVSWDPIPGVTYKVIITVGDPDCCGNSGTHPYMMVWDVLGTDTIIPSSVGNCFSWKVISICPDGTKSPESVKMCSCAPRCDAKTPTNLGCKTTTTGSHLTWDPIPGVTYKVIITVGDPDCCGDNGVHPYEIVWDVVGTDTLVPASLNCFSWKVISICPDGTKSQESDKKCSCAPRCDPKTPTNLGCKMTATGSHLTWDLIPGATYKVIITVGDPDCCGDGGIRPYDIVWDVVGTDTLVPASLNCFSWRVISICPDGTKSQESDKKCSCAPRCVPKAPTSLKCNTSTKGSIISWDPIPGAYYKVVLTINDPDCCPQSAALPYSIVWDVYGTDTLVRNSVAGCFSWKVIAICPDGTKSPESVTMCSCSSVIIGQCKDPYKLSCSVVQNGVQLGWAIPAGAGGYELEITYNDPACCRTTALQSVVVYGLSTNTYWVAPGGWKCFSWRVRSKCNTGGYSNWVNGGCNCTSAANLRQSTTDDSGNAPVMGKEIRVDAVPNPASDYVDFNLYGMENVKNQTMEITIHDITGREVSRKSVNADSKIRFDVYSLAPGLYIYKLSSNGQLFYSGKMMIDRK